MDTKKHIKTILGELFNKAIEDDFAQENEDDWDSFAHLDLVSKLEEDFKISLTPEEIGSMTSLPAIVAIINNKISE